MTETATKKSSNESNRSLPPNSLITREELDEFKQIALKDYGVELTDEQAFEQATALLNLFDHLINRRLESRRKDGTITST
jgi:hypothetical protein